MPASDEQVAHGLSAPSSVQLSELPTELTDAIIDHLHDEKNTLFSCSLVCNQWLESSRIHLFNSIIVRGEKPGKGFASFLAFLESTPTIRIHIRTLTFRITNALATRPQELRSVGPYILTVVLRSLPALQALILDNVTWDRTLLAGPDGQPIDWPSSSGSLDSFTLSRVMTEGLVQSKAYRLSDLIEVLWAFGSLRRLSLTNLNLEAHNSAPELPEFPDWLRLQELYVHANYTRIGASEALVAVHQAMSKHLRRVDMACNNDDEAPVVGQFLRIVGSTLQELRLDLSEMTVLRAFHAPGPWNMFNLPSLAALTSLELHVWTSGAHITGDLFTYDGQWCLCSVAPMLSLLQPTLRELGLTLSLSGYPPQLRSHLEHIDWAGLQRQLDRFPALEAVRLEVRPRRGHNVLPEALYVVSSIAERKLRPLVASGLLEVDVNPETTTVARPGRGVSAQSYEPRRR